MSTGEAFRTIGLACLRHCDGNCETITRGNAEGLHQMRVALRRLRVAMSIFQGKAATTSVFGREVKWFIMALAPARDFDVFLRERLMPLCEAQPNCAGLKTLLRIVRQRRRIEFSKAKALVNGDRYREFVLGAAFLLSNDPSKPGKERRLQSVADACFEHLTHGIHKRLKEFDSLDAKGRHKLRIMLKRVRYAIEFFEPLYAGKRKQIRLRRFKRAVKNLLDIVGTLNDITVQQNLIRELLREPGWNRQRQETFELGVLSGSEHAQTEGLTKAARSAGKALSCAPRFWNT